MKRKTVDKRRQQRKTTFEKGGSSKYSLKKQRQAKGNYSANSPFKVVNY